MHIQAGDGLRRSQRHRQLQLCVPLVGTTEEGYLRWTVGSSWLSGVWLGHDVWERRRCAEPPL